VRVLFRGGLRDADALLAEFDAVGDGDEDILIAGSSCDTSDISSFIFWIMCFHVELASESLQSPLECCCPLREVGQTPFY
jgi:hypothetical protein